MVDHVLDPEGTPAEAPGHRTKVGDGADALQIDVGSGDPLAVAAQRITIDGISVLAARPETMFGWKVHGLVELGHGQWKGKDLYDLYLPDRHCTLDHDALVASIALAFSSRQYQPAQVGGFPKEGDRAGKAG